MIAAGKKFSFGDVILAEVQYTDTFEIKVRPALVLFEEYGNIVCAAITSNPDMKGIPLTKKEGAIMDSVIKINYVFTISEEMVKKKLFRVKDDKKGIVKKQLLERMS
jgi:mRNA interferase MazF